MQKIIVSALFVLSCGRGESSKTDPSTNADVPGKADTPDNVPDPDTPLSTVGLDAGADTSCGSMAFAITRVPPNVMLVLDRSNSMNDSVGGGTDTPKWRQLKTVIQNLVTTFDSQVQFGLDLYSNPNDDDCSAGPVAVAPAPMTGMHLLAKMNATVAAGNTPTAKTLKVVYKSGYLEDPTRENYVVLATDGVPYCDDGSVNDYIAALYALPSPVKTFVIGIGSVNESDPDRLNTWAVAGHSARAGATKYYSSNTASELTGAFNAVLQQLVSCRFALAQAPPDPSQLYVWSDGQPVIADGQNGFVYDATSAQVQLFGAACDALRAKPSTNVQVVYGCPGPPPVQ